MQVDAILIGEHTSLIPRWKLWERATGPKTAEEKARSTMRGYKSGERQVNRRRMAFARLVRVISQTRKSGGGAGKTRRLEIWGGGNDGYANDVRYAFFETPTVFRVDLGAPGSPREDWVTVRLRLAEWVWKLSELRLP